MTYEQTNVPEPNTPTLRIFRSREKTNPSQPINMQTLFSIPPKGFLRVNELFVTKHGTYSISDPDDLAFFLALHDRETKADPIH